MRTILSILLVFCCGITFAQTTITGTVVDDNNIPVPSANIIVLGTSNGTVTDFDGNFTLTVDQNPPFTIQASSVGFESVSQEVTSNNQTLSFTLKEAMTLMFHNQTGRRIRHLPVIDNGELVGMVSNGDLLQRLNQEAEFENRVMKNYIQNWPEEDVS